MPKIRNIAEIKTCGDTPSPPINVTSHWLHHDKVVLEIDGKQYVVYGSDLKLAIDNCMNVGK